VPLKHAVRKEGTRKTSAMAAKDRNRLGSTSESGLDQKLRERGQRAATRAPKPQPQRWAEHS